MSRFKAIDVKKKKREILNSSRMTLAAERRRGEERCLAGPIQPVGQLRWRAEEGEERDP